MYQESDCWWATFLLSFFQLTALRTSPNITCHSTTNQDHADAEQICVVVVENIQRVCSPGKDQCFMTAFSSSCTSQNRQANGF